MVALAKQSPLPSVVEVDLAVGQRITLTTPEEIRLEVWVDAAEGGRAVLTLACDADVGFTDFRIVGQNNGS